MVFTSESGAGHNRSRIEISVENSPLKNRYDLQAVFGDSSAEIVDHEIQTTLPSGEMAVFRVR